MVEQFQRKFNTPYFQWKNFEQVCDYVEGKTDELEEYPLNSKKAYVWYEQWMRDELKTNGENAETAKRMLMVVSRVRRDGLITSTIWAIEDTRMLLHIGYDYDTVMKNLLKLTKDLSTKALYDVASVLVEMCPKEAAQSADRLLGSDLETLKKQRKSNHEIYLIMYMAAELMRKDAQTYERYLPVIIELSDRFKNDFSVQLLCNAYELSPVLKTKLLEELATNTQAAAVVLNSVGKKEMIPFLNKIEAERWSYYYCVMKAYDENDRLGIFSKLYAEDKVTFMQLYERMATSNTAGDHIYIPYLLTILLINGEGQKELSESGVILLSMLKQLLHYYVSANEREYDLSLLADEAITLSEALTKPLNYHRSFGWGDSKHIVTGFSLLYDYSSRARRFIHLLAEKSKKTSNEHNNHHYTASLYIDARKKWLGIEPETSLCTLIDSEANYTTSDAFATYCFVHTLWDGAYSHILSSAISAEFIEQHKEEALTLLNSGNLSIEETLVWVDLLYGTTKFKEYQPLIALLGNKSKKLRKKAEELLEALELEVRPTLEAGLSAMKGDVLAAAKRLIKKWDNDRKYGADFVFSTTQMVTDFCIDNYDKDNKKYISWIPEDLLLDVRFADMSDKAPIVVMQYLLSEYLSLEEPYKIKICDKVVDMLHRPDLQTAFENIYLYWKDNGAEAKKKMIMVPYCIYGSDTQILALRTQVKDWAEASRGAIAAFVVNAIAMNGGSVALMMIDSMGTKFPNNQVKNAAKAAFVFAAKALEIPEDVLSDKIVPTLGFNKEGEKVLDYGPRTFTITLLPDFSLSIFDNDKQKQIKSMPAPGANDDQVKATAAKKEFSEIKKQIKATVQAQTNRLEKVLMNGRRWKVDAWSELFVENPIMHRFATSLIWGAYKDDVLVETFRYMDDGTFNTVDEEEYTLPDNVVITLIHPSELTEETLQQWKEQLDDYEVVQPLPQLAMPVLELKKDEINEKKIIRYKDIVTESGKIASIAKKYNMVRGEVWDGGSFTCFHWVDNFLNMAAQLNFEYMWMGQDYDESVTLGEVVFYRLPEDGHVVEEVAANLILDPTDVPQRFLSSILGIFDRLKAE